MQMMKLTEGEYQLVFFDTPGMHKPKNSLGKYMVRSVNESVGGVDCCMLVVEAGREAGQTELDLIEKFKMLDMPAILAINKIDMIKEKDALMKQILAYSRLYDFDAIVPVSAQDGSGMDELLDELKRIKGVKKVFVRSGIRYDYVMYDDKKDVFLRAIIKDHISGRLKVAPEHVSDRVLKLMGKPRHQLYDAFVSKYNELNRKTGHEQFIVPYFMSSHPGSDLNAAVELALYLKKSGQRLEQVQDFYPTPGTLSTCMYYTGIDPRNGEKVYVARDPNEKAMQRALMQYFMPQYAPLARKALIKAS